MQYFTLLKIVANYLYNQINIYLFGTTQIFFIVRCWLMLILFPIFLSSFSHQHLRGSHLLFTQFWMHPWNVRVFCKYIDCISVCWYWYTDCKSIIRHLICSIDLRKLWPLASPSHIFQITQVRIKKSEDFIEFHPLS